MAKTKSNNARLKASIHLAFDMLILLVSALISVLIHIKPESFLNNYLFGFVSWLIIVSVVYPTMYYVGGIHKIIWNFSTTYDAFKYGLIVVFSSLITFVIHFTVTTAISVPARASQFPFKVTPLPLSGYFTTLAIAIILILFKTIL